jgi:hypothetical protein
MNAFAEYQRQQAKKQQEQREIRRAYFKMIRRNK